MHEGAPPVGERHDARPIVVHRRACHGTQVPEFLGPGRIGGGFEVREEAPFDSLDSEPVHSRARRLLQGPPRKGGDFTRVEVQCA